MSKEGIRLNIPNLISLLRLLCVPLTVWLIINNQVFAAFWIFVFASISDALDGFIAKRFNLQTELGAYLDPIADKILTTFLILALSLELSSIFVSMIGGIILAREYWVGALRDLNSKNGNYSATNVTYLAKIKTSLQFLTFASFLSGLYLENSLIIFLSYFLLFLALIVTLQTGLSYTIATFKR